MGHTPTSLAAGFAITASPGPGGPSRQAARPVIPLTARPDNGGAGQVQRHRQVPSRRAAAPARPRSADTADRGDPAWGEGRAPAGRDLLPGKRRTCRVCYTPPARAATARGDVAAGRRGRIADMTTLMLPADLAAVSSPPLAGQRAAPADYALRVDGEFAAAGRRGTAGTSASPSLVFSCTGRIARGAPARSQIRALGRERSCRWPCRAVGGRASGLDVAAGPRSASQPGRGNRARQSPTSAGSPTARTVPARPARQASPLGWWSRSWFRPVATAASSCHSRQRA